MFVSHCCIVLLSIVFYFNVFFLFAVNFVIFSIRATILLNLNLNMTGQERQDRTDRQRSDRIWRSVLRAVAPKPLNRHNSATFYRMAMKFGTITHFNLSNLHTIKKFIFLNKKQHGRLTMTGHVRDRCTQSDSARYRTGTVQMPMRCILAPTGEYD